MKKSEKIPNLKILKPPQPPPPKNQNQNFLLKNEDLKALNHLNDVNNEQKNTFGVYKTSQLILILRNIINDGSKDIKYKKTVPSFSLLREDIKFAIRRVFLLPRLSSGLCVCAKADKHELNGRIKKKIFKKKEKI